MRAWEVNPLNRGRKKAPLEKSERGEKGEHNSQYLVGKLPPTLSSEFARYNVVLTFRDRVFVPTHFNCDVPHS